MIFVYSFFHDVFSQAYSEKEKSVASKSQTYDYPVSTTTELYETHRVMWQTSMHTAKIWMSMWCNDVNEDGIF